MRLERAPIELKPALRGLLTQYLVELAALEGKTRERDENGHVPYYWFDYYWITSEQTRLERIPLAMWEAGELIGFCLLRDTGENWQVAEFFVLPEYRRHGIGAAAVTAVKEFCKSAGRYDELEADTLKCNPNALAFWRSQGFVTVGEEPEMMINLFYLPSVKLSGRPRQTPPGSRFSP